MTSEKMTISFEDFVKYFIRKWKITAGIVIVFVALFAGGAKLLGEEISVPHSEEYLYYEKESEWLESYLKESTLMQINPTEIPERTLFLENVTDSEHLKDYALSRDIWKNHLTDRKTEYLYELLTWQEDEAENVQLILRHVTAEECLKAAEYLKGKLESYDYSLEVTIGEARIAKDEDLQDEQLRWYDRIDYSKSLLLDSQAGYTIKVNMVAAALTGAIAGGLLSVVIVFVMCILGKNKTEES